MKYLCGISMHGVRSELIDYALSALPSTSSNEEIVTSICQRWQDQSPLRKLTVDQFNILRYLAHQALGIAKKSKGLRKKDLRQYRLF